MLDSGCDATVYQSMIVTLYMRNILCCGFKTMKSISTRTEFRDKPFDTDIVNTKPKTSKLIEIKVSKRVHRR